MINDRIAPIGSDVRVLRRVTHTFQVRRKGTRAVSSDTSVFGTALPLKQSPKLQYQISMKRPHAMVVVLW